MRLDNFRRRAVSGPRFRLRNGFVLALFVPWVALACGLALTALMWHQARQAADRAADQMFEQRVSHATLAIDRVLGDLNGLLRVVRSHFESRPDMNDDEFITVLSEQEQRSFSSGLQYVGFVRASARPGCRQFDVTVPPQSGGAPSILSGGCLSFDQVYPRATNEHLLGKLRDVDTASRAATITRAMDYGYVAFTEPLGIQWDNIANPGLIAYLPVYRRDVSLATVPGRRQALLGLAVAAFSFEDLLRAELGGEFFVHTSMTVTDSGLVGRAADGDNSPKAVLDSNSLLRAFSNENGQSESDALRRTITQDRQHAGRNWLVTFAEQEDAAGALGHWAPNLIMFLGTLISLLACASLQMLIKGRRRADRLAQRMTEHLREREAQLRQALDAAEMGSWTWDGETGKFDFDERSYHMLALTDGPIQNLLNRIHPDDQTSGKIALKQAIETGAPFYTECRLATAVDGVRWVELSARLTLGADGAVQRASGLVRNVTERYRLITARRHLLSKLITAEEKERRRIARELHDQLGQEITAIALGLRNLQEMTGESDGRKELLKQLKGIVSNIDDRVERFSLDLRPVVLDDLGLEAALKAQFAQWSELHGIQVNSHLLGLPSQPLMFELSTTIFRVVQESLTNVARHSGASAVDVIIEAVGDEIKMVIEDNGTGQTGRPGSQSHGLAGMRERVEALGGQFRVESSQGAGFSVFVRLPISLLEPQAAPV